ncbi:hypothetical protein N9J51_03645, partial [Alphaproteobacteria bacterium]|nr:hypothetical protein [Alphaproteobacteria bacterium]
EKVRDPLISSALLSKTAGLSGSLFEESVKNWCESQGIKSLRILETLSIIPVTDQSGRAYKGYKGDGNAYMEIYEEPDSGKWKSEIVSRFDANQKSFVPGWRKSNPTAKIVMRLRTNDLVKLSDDNSIYRVQKLSGGEITMASHIEANVDARHRDKDDPFRYFTTSATSLQKRSGVKLNISPTGLISEVQ